VREAPQRPTLLHLLEPEVVPLGWCCGGCRRWCRCNWCRCRRCRRRLSTRRFIDPRADVKADVVRRALTHDDRCCRRHLDDWHLAHVELFHRLGLVVQLRDKLAEAVRVTAELSVATISEPTLYAKSLLVVFAWLFRALSWRWPRLPVAESLLPNEIGIMCLLDLVCLCKFKRPRRDADRR